MSHTRAEIDTLWNKLTDGGTAEVASWGLSDCLA